MSTNVFAVSILRINPDALVDLERSTSILRIPRGSMVKWNTLVVIFAYYNWRSFRVPDFYWSHTSQLYVLPVCSPI
jgi:hypothetical protein